MEKNLKNTQKILEPLSNAMMITEINDIELVKLRKINFEDFKDFIYSLKSEKETWSLDTNITGIDGKQIGDYTKNVIELKRWYECVSTLNQALVCTNRSGEILGISYYIR